MATYKMKRDIRKMFKWAIMKMFENDSEGVISIYELKHELSRAWEELFEEGKIEDKLK